MDLKDSIKQYIESAKVMQLATVKDGKPWICTVNYAYDNQWNLYWLSQRSRRHSQELALHSDVAVAIVRDPAIKQCLHIEGEAVELYGEDLIKAHELYSARFGGKPEWLAEAQSGDPTKRAYYKVSPTYCVLFDEINAQGDPRQEYRLS